MCCLRLAANTGRKKSRQESPSGHHRTTSTGYIFATKARIDNRKKNLLSSNISSRCPHNMVNFGLLPAEIVSLVWGTPANFNGFRVLAALLHGTLVVGVSQTAAFNRGRQLYSAGRPSGWALAHIPSLFCVQFRFSFSFYSAASRSAKHCDEHVCLLAYLKNVVKTSQNFLYMLTVAMAQSSSHTNAIRYVLAVLWMTSCLPRQR